MPKTSGSSTVPPAAISPHPDGKFVDLGAVVASWIESNLVHGEGDFYGQPFVLDAFQRDILYRIYLTNAQTGVRVVRRALIILPKGTGKTELVAAIMLAELCGLVVVVNGRPARRTSPNIPVAAASYEQSDRLFGAAASMAAHEDSALRDVLAVFEHEIRLKGGPGRMFRVAAVAGTNDGGLPTAFAADEVHEWTGAKERVHLVIGNSLAKRRSGLELNISTPDDAQPDSLLGRLVRHGEAVASGEVSDPSFFYVRFAAKGEYDLDDPAELRAAIVEATPATFVDVERVAQRYEVDHIPRHEFERYHLGRFVRPTRAWIPEGKWDPLARTDPIPDGSDVVVGFHGSYNRNSTGLVACTMDGHLEVLAAWERPDRAPEDWIVPRAEVDAAVDAAFARFHVVELPCDPRQWTSEIEAWQQRYGDVVLDFPTSTPARMSPACARFYGAVVAGVGLSHDGDPRLSRHLHNAITKEHHDGAYIAKENRDSPRKIDLAVAAVLAYDRAMWHAEQAAKEPLVAWA